MTVQEANEENAGPNLFILCLLSEEQLNVAIIIMKCILLFATSRFVEDS